VTAPQSGLSLSYQGSAVRFPDGPVSIDVVRRASTTASGAQAQNTVRMVTGVAPLTFSLTGLRLDGIGAAQGAGTLAGWLDPAAGAPTADGDKGVNNRENTKKLSLSMGTGPGYASGDGITGTVLLRDLRVRYDRFNAQGDPILARISMTLETVPENQPKQNPTSFSPAGGRVHLTADGDSLAGIAQRTYADPGAWRVIADANGIDDPLRVATGRNLFLPYARN
jgi:hypothetical protein